MELMPESPVQQHAQSLLVVRDQRPQGARQPRRRECRAALRCVTSALESSPDASSRQKPPSVQFSLSQLYTLKMGNTEKLVKSLITLHVDPSDNLIIK